MSDTMYDVVVVGAGIVGSCAALAAARLGKRVLLLEQYPVEHAEGSSCGLSRITRSTYIEPQYARLTPEAFDLWAEMEEESGLNLYIETGGLMVGRLDGGLGRVYANCKRFNTPHKLLSAEQIKQQFGLVYPEGTVAVLEKNAGVLRAANCVKAAQMLFRRLGGEVRDREPVTAIRPGRVAEVETRGGVVRATSVVLAPGAWLQDMLAGLGLDIEVQVLNMLVTYFKTSTPTYHYSKFPVLIDYDAANIHIYGLPCCEYADMFKLCVHDGDKVKISERTKNPSDQFLPQLATYIGAHMPNVEPAPAKTDACMYTMTKTEDYIVDRHPDFRNIVIAGGFSGHGFKLAPVVGKVLALLALDLDTSQYELGEFRLQKVLRGRHTTSRL